MILNVYWHQKCAILEKNKVLVNTETFMGKIQELK